MPPQTRAETRTLEQARLDDEAAGLVWVMRHGERADVADPSWDAATAERPHDPPLTELGVRQALATGQDIRARSARVDVVYTSPFLRCVQTAAAVAAELGGVPLRVEPGLSELAHAEWFDAPPIDAGMATPALQLAASAIAPGVRIDASYRPLFDTAERSAACGHGTARFDPVAFPETSGESTARFEATSRALRQASPFSVIATHGYGVWVICEEAIGRELWEDTPYCCLTRMRQQVRRPAVVSGPPCTHPRSPSVSPSVSAGVRRAVGMRRARRDGAPQDAAGGEAGGSAGEVSGRVCISCMCPYFQSMRVACSINLCKSHDAVVCLLQSS